MSSRLSYNMSGLVSLEGNTSIISMQLRLLPPSPKLLVLPPLSTAVRLPEGDGPFDARAFIKNVHEALSTRLDLARSFLQYSSCMQPRLVFMNGGSITALTTCIAVICEKVTDGNILEAKELFNAIAKDGVAGLSLGGAIVDGDESRSAFTDAAEKEGRYFTSGVTRSSSNSSHISHIGPSAVDAAGFIDHLIDTLQKPLPSLPMSGQDQRKTESSEHTRTTATPVPPDVPRLKSRFWTAEEVITKNEGALKEINRGRRLGAEGKQDNLNYLPYLRYTSRDSSTYTDAIMYQQGTKSDGGNSSVLQERPASAPSIHRLAMENDYSSPHIQSKLARHAIKRARSVDCFHSIDAQSSSLDIGPRKLKLGKFSSFTFSPHLMSKTASTAASESSESSEGSSIPEASPGADAEKSLSSSISRMKMSSGDPYHTPIHPDAHSRACKSSDDTSGVDTHASNIKEPAPFEPVFALFEDFIIHIKDGGSNELLESVIHSYKNGSYPIKNNNVQQVPMTPTSPASTFSLDRTSLSRASHTSADSHEEWPQETVEIEPEKDIAHSSRDGSDIWSEISSETSSEGAPDSPSVYPSDEASITQSNDPLTKETLVSDRKNPGNTIQSILKPRLQIPVKNPVTSLPELVTDTVAKIEELHGISTTNTVALQDSFRGLLKVRYPPETTHYKQHIFALENDRFWKPVFRMDARQGGEERTVDQIVALGYEDGVEKTLYKEVIEQLDKLETSATGIRASKLDMRFLVIYAMQTFTSQPLCLQAGENPFSQPSLLATLLIPHLETFLSSSSPTRLLILHYPVSHLSTVLALRDLLGSQLLKIAGIIDSTAISPPKTSIDRSNSIASIDEWVSTTTAQCPSLSQEFPMSRTPRASPKSLMAQPSFSKADFLLLSPATQDEISIFLSSIWKSFTFPSSSFLVPDGVLSPSGTPHPTVSASTGFSHETPPTPPPDRQMPIATSEMRLSPTRAPKRVSFADSTTSTDISTDNARRREKQSQKDWEKLENERRERLSEKAWESFVMGNESDASLLELERIFMPHLHFMPRAVRHIGDSRKALKWLGLD